MMIYLSARRRWAALLPLILAAGFILACGGTNTSTVVTGTVTAPTGPQHFKVGEQVRTGNWVVVLNGATTNPGDPVDQPRAGDTYLVLDLSFRNLDSTDHVISSILQFTLSDDQGQQYPIQLVNFIQHHADGDVQAGGLLRGDVAYEIDKNTHHFVFAFKADVTASGATLWDVNV